MVCTRRSGRVPLRRAFLLWAATVTLAACDRTPPPARQIGLLPEGQLRPNVVLILIDTLRADRLGTYGNPRGLSPQMDALASEGVVFEWAIAPSSWTMPSMASIFTGLYPSVHKVTRFQKPNELNDPTFKLTRLPESLLTLAEALEIEGYQTAGFTANPFTLHQYGFGDGFGVFDERFAVDKVVGDGRRINAAAEKWLRERRDPDRPFFLYLHYMDVHGPYDADESYFAPLLQQVEASVAAAPNAGWLDDQQVVNLEYLDTPPTGAPATRHMVLRRYRTYWEARYEAGVREMDEHLADLRGRLAGLGVWDDAYVVLTSDHGEALCEHGWWDHGYSVRTPEVHVPLVLRWTGVLPAGKRIPHVASLVGLMPTLLAQLRLPPAPGASVAPFLPLLDERPPATAPEAFVEFVRVGAQQKGLYRGPWKLVYYTVGSTTHELFDMKSDASEQHDLVPSNRRIADEMYQSVVALVKSNERRGREMQQQLVDVTNRDSLANHGYFDKAGDRGSTTPPPGGGVDAP